LQLSRQTLRMQPFPRHYDDFLIPHFACLSKPYAATANADVHEFSHLTVASFRCHNPFASTGSRHITETGLDSARSDYLALLLTQGHGKWLITAGAKTGMNASTRGHSFLLHRPVTLSSWIEGIFQEVWSRQQTKQA